MNKGKPTHPCELCVTDKQYTKQAMYKHRKKHHPDMPKPPTGRPPKPPGAPYPRAPKESIFRIDRIYTPVKGQDDLVLTDAKCSFTCPAGYPMRQKVARRLKRANAILKRK